MERGGGFDKEAFDNLLKQILEAKEKSSEPSEEKPAAASKKDQGDAAPSASPEPTAEEPEGAIAPPANLPAVATKASSDHPVESAASKEMQAERVASQQGAVHSDMDTLKQRLADLEATQGRLMEQLQQSTDQLAAAAQKASAPTTTEAPSSQSSQAAPSATSEPGVFDEPVAAERAMVKVPNGGELSRPEGQGFLDHLLNLLHRLFPSFVPAKEATQPADTPDALYAGRIDLVISAEDAWGRLERILTGLAGLRGAQVHGLYSGSHGEQTVSLEMDVPASIKDIQAAVPDLKEIRTISSHKGVTRLAVKIT